MGTAIDGTAVGHYTDEHHITGCTVILCEKGAVAGVDVRGSAPGTRETDLLHPVNLVKEVNAIMLGGGSAFGLGASDGVMRYLSEKGAGYPTMIKKVPIVPSAIIFDLGIGDPDAYPVPDNAYAACLSASTEFAEGSVGVGTGATVGGFAGFEGRTKSGFGSDRMDLPNGLSVMALAVVNAVGNALDETGQVMAGARAPGGGFLDAIELFKAQTQAKTPFESPSTGAQNTTLAVVMTNAKLNKEEANKVAQMAHDGFARAIKPAHTMFDGDVSFALATGQIRVPSELVGVFGAEVTERAIRNAVRQATSLGGVPAIRDLEKQ